MSFFRYIGNHLANWMEGYFWVPMALGAIYASGLIVEWMTGYPMKENVDWIVEYQRMAYKCVLLILFTSIGKQSFGTWLTKEEKLAHPINHAIVTVGSIAIFYGLLYAFTH